MQVDPSICADTSISEKEKGVGEEEISKPFTAKLEPYLVKFINLFQITPQKEKKESSSLCQYVHLGFPQFFKRTCHTRVRKITF